MPTPPQHPHLILLPSPIDYSYATTAILTNEIILQADNGQFAINVANTNLRYSGFNHGFPPAIASALAPRTPANARLYSWWLPYRQRYRTEQLVVDVNQDELARAVLTQSAIKWMNALNLRYAVRPTPNPDPDVGGVFVLPG